MSKVRMSVRSRRMVRRNREWFALMDETGLTSDQLRTFLALRDAMSSLGATIARELAPLLATVAEIAGES